VWAFSRISKRPDVYVAEWVLGAGLIVDTLVWYRFLVGQGVVRGIPVEPLPVPTWLVLLSLFVISFVLIHLTTHSPEEIEAIDLTGMERRAYSTFGLLVAFGWGPGTMLIAITNGAVFL
jgi:hypothetical protein